MVGYFFTGIKTLCIFSFSHGVSDSLLPPKETWDGFANPFPNDKILNSSKLKEFADDNFEFNDNGRKFSKRVENTVGKGEIARYEQFLLFPQCFQMTCTAHL